MAEHGMSKEEFLVTIQKAQIVSSLTVTITDNAGDAIMVLLTAAAALALSAKKPEADKADMARDMGSDLGNLMAVMEAANAERRETATPGKSLFMVPGNDSVN